MSPLQKVKNTKMPLSHKVSKVHKALIIFILFLVKPLSFSAFVAEIGFPEWAQS